MIPWRFTEHVKVQYWIAVGVISAVMVGTPAAALEQFPSDEIPQDFLDACDARAMPFDAYDPVISDAVNALIDMGVFSQEEFQPVTIGFCDLRSVQGPVATASCARNSILLDSRYAEKDKNLVLQATLAHEMKHHLQHKAQKAEHGDGYCSSARYLDDKSWMEEEADAFGDEVAALFFVGRPVEIINECAGPASFYLEADNPVSTNGDAPTFTDIPARSTILSTERAVSKYFKLYAKATIDSDRQKTWGDAGMADRRRIDGDIYGLKNVSLGNPSRSKGPFQLRLACND